MSYTSGAPAQAVRLWLTWLAIALLGTLGVFSMFDGLAEGDVEAGWSGVLILSVIVLSLLHKRPGFRRAVDPALESLGRKCSAVTMVAMSIGIPLTGIYLLVRFIRWAWTD